MNRSIKIAGAQTGKNHFEGGYKILAQKTKSRADYEAAIRHFDKAMSLGYKDPLCAESKVSACFRLSLHEEAEYRRANRKAAIPGTLRMPDGSAHWKNAFHGAEAAAKKTGLKRWQPYYLLAECLLHKESYADAQRAIETCQTTASYLSAKPAVVDKVRGLADRIWSDGKHNARRRAGRAEMDAIAHEMHREAELKKVTNYTPLLQDDLWLLIAEYATTMDPLAAWRMSCVNQRLRGVMLSAPGMWNSLTLGDNRKLEARVTAHLERCTGGDRSGLRKVTIRPGCDRLEAFPSIQDRMRDHMANVRDFDLELDALDHRLTIWRHKFPNVSKLRVAASMPTVSHDMTFGLVPTHSSSLREMYVRNIYLQPSLDLQGRYQADRDAGRPVPPLTIPNAGVQLANLRRFDVKGGQLGQGLDEYLLAMPKLQVLRLDGVRIVYISNDDANTAIANTHTVTLEHLDTVELHVWQPQATSFFHDLYAPNLRSLAIVDMPNYVPHLHLTSHPTIDVATQMSARGLKDALAKLTSLELFRSSVTTAQILPLLKQMDSLRHLGLGFTGVQNDLIQALVKGDEDAQGKRVEILPKLEALCVAGMMDLNAADLRDLVCAKKGLPLRSGKLVDGSTPAGASAPASQTAGPAAPKRAKGLFGAARNPNRASTQVVPPTATPATATPSSQAVCHISASAPAPLASTQEARAKYTPLRWLNVDHCQSLDYSIVDWLHAQISSVSANMANDAGFWDRMMGKGQWRWDLDREVCRHEAGVAPKLGEAGYVGPCGTVEDKATGQWYIMHTCGVYTKSGKGYVSRSSQADASSHITNSQASQDPVERFRGKGKGKVQQKEKEQEREPEVVVRRGGWGWGSNLPSNRIESAGSAASKRARDE